MVSEIDVREQSGAAARDNVIEQLDEVDVADTATVLADHDIEAALYQYQIKRGDPLTWSAEESGPDEWEYQVTKDDDAADDSLTAFDVREMPPQQRHEVLLDTFQKLDPGEGFVLVNDHDPKPLYHELQSMHGDTFDWEYTNRDSQPWKVEIVKTDESTAESTDVQATFDVRKIPKPERHPTIHHRYGNIAEGETLEVIAPHEPRHLKQEFHQKYGQSYTWEVLDNSCGQVRVHITKESPTATESEADVETGALDVTTELDVRSLPPAQRHEQIFEKYEELALGEGFVLVNDHDPKPLYHQFKAEAGDEFRWEYQHKTPGEFRVLVGKSESGDADSPQGSTRAPF